jgi:hypothetical protein
LTNATEDQVTPRISGGYILEASSPEKLHEREKAVQFRTSTDINFTFKYPKPQNVTSAQRQWIINYLNEFEAVLWDGNKFTDPVNGFRKYINIPSFIDWTILHELSKGCDNLFHASVFVHKDRDDKLNMSAPWDFDLSFGNSGIYSDDGKWLRDHHRWFHRVHRDENYVIQYNNRYEELRPFIETVPAILKANFRQLEEAGVIEREITKWPQILREYRSNEGLITALEYKTHIQYLSEWIMSRHNWIYVDLGTNDQEKGDRMKTIRPVMRILDPEGMQAGTGFNVKVMRSEDNNNKYTYSWNDGAYNNTSSRRISQKGKHWVKIKDDRGNISLTSDTIYYGVERPPTSIAAEHESPFFTYNNPAKNFIEISYFSSKNFDLAFQLFDLKGSTVFRQKIPVQTGNNKIQIPVSVLEDGVYIMHLLTEKGMIFRRIILNGK